MKKSELKMERIIVTNPMIGICGMQVCAVKDATDEEILKVCNLENRSGTTNGWSKVVRKIEENFTKKHLPTKCSEYSDRIHFLIYC